MGARLIRGDDRGGADAFDPFIPVAGTEIRNDRG